MKRCTHCGEMKERDKFWRDVTKRDGLQSWCKPCKGEQNKAYAPKPTGLPRGRRPKMAVAGGAKPSMMMRIEGNKLVSEDAGMRQGAINDIDLAIHRLLLGETVYVQLYAPIVSGIRRTVEAVLRGDDSGGRGI